MVILAVAVFVGLRYWPADKAPNIVLITIDTQRWDYLSSYGYSDPGLAEYLASLNEEFLAADSRSQDAQVSEEDRYQLQGLGYTQ